MAATKTTALTANATPALTDILYLVDDPGGTPLGQKITVAALLATPSPTLTGTVKIGSGANRLEFAGSTTTNPVTITAAGSDADIAIKLAPKGLGFLQLGPDTYGNDWGAGDTHISLEIYRTVATKPVVEEIWVETYAADLPNGRANALSTNVGTPGEGAINDLNRVEALSFTATSSLPIGRTINEVIGVNGQGYATGGGNVTAMTAYYAQVLADEGSSVDTAYLANLWMYDISPNSGEGTDALRSVGAVPVADFRVRAEGPGRRTGE